MTDLESQAPDEVWCGGDIGWGGPWASECIAQVREAGWVAIKGNTDVWITGDPQTIDDADDRERLRDVARAHAIDKEAATWLINLPLGHHGAGSVLLVHGTPTSPFQAPQPDAPAGEFEPYVGRANVVVYAHIHIAFSRRLADGTIVCNPGSVGMPKDGPTASYLVLDLAGAEITMRHRRVEFDRRAGVAQARALGGPIERIFTENVPI